jgi:hypothetical protein
MINIGTKAFINAVALMLLTFSACTLVGCEKKEKVLDVETPSGELEIERDKDSGSVGVELKKKDDN